MVLTSFQGNPITTENSKVLGMGDETDDSQMEGGVWKGVFK